MPNYYKTSTGEKVSQAAIEARLRQAYLDAGGYGLRCKGCGRYATCRAHIIAKARCKQLGKTELIWNPINFFLSCYECNSAIESYKGTACAKLHNYEQCLEVLREHDPEMYQKHVTFGGTSTLV